jgi:hypothetical protein
MSLSVIVHIANEDPVVCEVESLPKATAQLITIHNPRRKDGKDLHYLEEDVSTLIIPFHRINFIQVLPSAEVDDVIGFVRD